MNATLETLAENFRDARLALDEANKAGNHPDIQALVVAKLDTEDALIAELRRVLPQA